MRCFLIFFIFLNINVFSKNFHKNNAIDSSETGTTVLLKFFKEKNANVVYGLPGSGTLNFDWGFAGDRRPFYKSDQKESDQLKNINYYHVVSEMYGAMSAGVYGKIKDSVGILSTTRGPGIGVALNGLIDATLEARPLISIHGVATLDEHQMGAFQYFSYNKTLDSFVKKSFLVKSIDELIDVLPKAYSIAKFGTKENPGPGCVSLVIVKKVFKQKVSYKKLKDLQKVKIEKSFVDCKDLRKDINDIIIELKKAKKPVIVVGYGVFLEKADLELLKLARKLNIPVVSTWKGKGVFDENEKLSLKNGGALGYDAANAATYYADFVLELGNRCFNLGQHYESLFNVVYSDNSKKYIVNLFPFFEKSYKTDCSYKNKKIIKCDTKQFLEQIGKKLQNENLAKKYEDWTKLCLYRKKIFEENHYYDTEYSSDVIKAPYALKVISEKIPQINKNNVLSNAVITTGVGSQPWLLASQFFNYSSCNNIVTPYIHASIGCGIPYGIGAYDANPNQPVYVLEGDGGFYQTYNVLNEVANRKLPLKIFVLNNGKYQAVWDAQKKRHFGRWTTHSITHPLKLKNWRKTVEGIGIKYYEVSSKKNLEKVIQDAINEKEAVLVNINTTSSEILTHRFTKKYFDSLKSHSLDELKSKENIKKLHEK
jgi:acetolactate synthase I/II/III large subunit